LIFKPRSTPQWPPSGGHFRLALAGGVSPPIMLLALRPLREARVTGEGFALVICARPRTDQYENTRHHFDAQALWVAHREIRVGFQGLEIGR